MSLFAANMEHLSVIIYMHILGDPSGVHDFASAIISEMTMTITPNVAQITAGSLAEPYHGSFLSMSLI